MIHVAAFIEVDHVKSVSSRTMAGRCFKGGTGLCDVLMDNDIIENSEFTKQTKLYSKDVKTQVEENKFIKHMFSKICSNRFLLCIVFCMFVKYYNSK